MKNPNGQSNPLINHLKNFLSLPREDGSIDRAALTPCLTNIAKSWASWCSSNDQEQDQSVFRQIKELGKGLTDDDLLAGHATLADLKDQLLEIGEPFPDAFELATAQLAEKAPSEFSAAAIPVFVAPSHFVDPAMFNLEDHGLSEFRFGKDQDQGHSDYQTLVKILKFAGLDYAPPLLDLARETYHRFDLVWQTKMPNPFSHEPAQVVDFQRLDRPAIEEVNDEIRQDAIQRLAQFATEHGVTDLNQICVDNLGLAHYHLVFLIYINESGDLSVFDLAFRVRPDLLNLPQ